MKQLAMSRPVSETHKLPPEPKTRLGNKCTVNFSVKLNLGGNHTDTGRGQEKSRRRKVDSGRGPQRASGLWAVEADTGSVL